MFHTLWIVGQFWNISRNECFWETDNWVGKCTLISTVAHVEISSNDGRMTRQQSECACAYVWVCTDYMHFFLYSRKKNILVIWDVSTWLGIVKKVCFPNGIHRSAGLIIMATFKSLSPLPHHLMQGSAYSKSMLRSYDLKISKQLSIMGDLFTNCSSHNLVELLGNQISTV